MMDMVYDTEYDRRYEQFWSTAELYRDFALEYMSHHTNKKDLMESIATMNNVRDSMWRNPVVFKLAEKGLSIGAMLQTFSVDDTEYRYKAYEEIIANPEILEHLNDSKTRWTTLNNLYNYKGRAKKHEHYYRTFIRFKKPEIGLNHYNDGVPLTFLNEFCHKRSLSNYIFNCKQLNDPKYTELLKYSEYNEDWRKIIQLVDSGVVNTRVYSGPITEELSLRYIEERYGVKFDDYDKPRDIKLALTEVLLEKGYPIGLADKLHSGINMCFTIGSGTRRAKIVNKLLRVLYHNDSAIDYITLMGDDSGLIKTLLELEAGDSLPHELINANNV